MQLEALKRQAFLALQSQGIENAALEARLLCELAFNLTATELLTKTLQDYDEAKLTPLLARRLKGEPIQRLRGSTEFYGLEFQLNEVTLIPRADTETLVEEALKQCGKSAHILDLGTGTGCIVISLLHTLKETTAVAADISEKALEAALANAKAHDVESRLTLICSDWFNAIHGKFDLIVSNPPYIAYEETSQLSTEVLEHDPHEALFALNDGLAAYEAIFKEAKRFLKPAGKVIVEIGYKQADSVTQIAVKNGFLCEKLTHDLAGNPRVLTFSLN